MINVIFCHTNLLFVVTYFKYHYRYSFNIKFYRSRYDLIPSYIVN